MEQGALGGVSDYVICGIYHKSYFDWLRAVPKQEIEMGQALILPRPGFRAQPLEQTEQGTYDYTLTDELYVLHKVTRFVVAAVSDSKVSLPISSMRLSTYLTPYSKLNHPEKLTSAFMVSKSFSRGAPEQRMCCIFR